jgi:hypothetical protein
MSVQIAPRVLATSITIALRSAFGGDSQVSDKVIGMAVFGHANNASAAWTEDYVREVIDAAAALTFAKWEECGAVLSETSEAIVEGYRAARAGQVGATHAPVL